MRENVQSLEEKLAQTREIVRTKQEQSAIETREYPLTIKTLRESIHRSERKMHEMCEAICPLSGLWDLN
jgi:hypothetical protein